MHKDHRVRFRRQESVAASAAALRERMGLIEVERLNVVDLVRQLTRGTFLGKGRLTLSIFDGAPGGVPAFVRFEPFSFNVDRELWDLAQLGDPYSNFILAHECGHVVLHDHEAKAFAVYPLKYNLFGMEEVSAETQANWFADHLLLPDNILGLCRDVEDAIIKCGVGRELVLRRWPSQPKARLSGVRFGGDACPECQNFNMVEKGSVFMCEICGQTTPRI